MPDTFGLQEPWVHGRMAGWVCRIRGRHPDPGRGMRRVLARDPRATPRSRRSVRRSGRPRRGGSCRCRTGGADGPRGAAGPVSQRLPPMETATPAGRDPGPPRSPAAGPLGCATAASASIGGTPPPAPHGGRRGRGGRPSGRLRRHAGERGDGFKCSAGSDASGRTCFGHVTEGPQGVAARPLDAPRAAGPRPPLHGRLGGQPPPLPARAGEERRRDSGRTTWHRVRPDHDDGGQVAGAHCRSSSSAVVTAATSARELRITSAVQEAGTPAMASAGTTTR